MKKEFEQIKNKTISELIKDKKSIQKDVVLEIAKMAQSGKKSSNKIKQLKRNIAWIETAVSGKITEVQAGK